MDFILAMRPLGGEVAPWMTGDVSAAKPIDPARRQGTCVLRDRSAPPAEAKMRAVTGSWTGTESSRTGRHTRTGATGAPRAIAVGLALALVPIARADVLWEWNDAALAAVIDAWLPEMDGPAVVQRLKLDPALRSIPCLLLTGSLDT